MGSTAGTAGTATGSAPARRGGEVRIVLGLTCQLLAVLLMNQALFPLFDGVFTYTRDICIVFSAVCLIVLSVGVMRQPRLARGRTFDRACCAAAPVAFAGVVFGVLLHMPALLVPAACVAALCRSWASVAVNLAAVSLPGERVGLCAVAGVAFAYALDTALFALCPVWVCAALAFVVLPLAMVALCGGVAERLTDAIVRSEPAADLAVTRPASFLPLSSTLYVFQLIVFVAFGFALRFGEVDGSPSFSTASGALCSAALLALVFARKGRLSLDALCNLVVLALVAGMALASTASPDGTHVATTVLAVGNAFYNAFITCVLVNLAQRNRYAALSTFGWANGIGGLGTTLGAFMGTSANGLLAADNAGALSLVVVAFLTVFVGYVLFALRNYSFHAEIESVVEPAPVATAQIALNAEELFSARCHDIARVHGLTPREEETFAMLARGRNREYIENALQVSRNTVKAHVKHVYAKLGIHSHQELIDLVEDGPDAAGRCPMSETMSEKMHVANEMR